MASDSPQAPGTPPGTPGIDFVAVNRMAHEVQSAHGRGAHDYATRMAEQCKAEGKTEQHAFWEAVAARL